VSVSLESFDGDDVRENLDQTITRHLHPTYPGR
jgi:hypothetical protein